MEQRVAQLVRVAEDAATAAAIRLRSPSVRPKAAGGAVARADAPLRHGGERANGSGQVRGAPGAQSTEPKVLRTEAFLGECNCPRMPRERACVDFSEEARSYFRQLLPSFRQLALAEAGVAPSSTGMQS